MNNKTNTVKSGFGSRLGFILAAAGSAVGLGNIWRFPYLAAKYGGGMFLLTYLIFAVTFGFALMITEIAIGRKTGKSVIGAYSAMDRRFAPLGWLAAAIPVVILPYYCVIGGWVLKYLTEFTTGAGKSTAGNGDYFSEFISSPVAPMVFFVVFIVLTAVVVMLGVKNGIEKVSKILMPVLLLLIVGIGIYTLTLPGTVFFVLVALAALTSSISLMETVVSIMCERFKLKRVTSCLIVIVFSFLLGMVSIFGYSIWSDFTIFKMQMLDFFDFVSNNIMMPVVALMTCILIGFVVKAKYIEDEIELNAKFKSRTLYRIMIKYICPACMIVILLSSLFISL